ncbi:YihY/virulence factor BrkB family protein [Flavobacterium sp. GT3R68]|uniref:YihY/virulence factor BrkB family protein n=1 Tax=Flavobacterium sp. GT3R68 TaxID=2594437 RepID=UPI000F882509|nr:YihY/virulence factor BrkB family protein [Flavobacterium sp. GT3R68]RTY86790.1 YihY/virulence factor BrkB family protein [Flavobacterium sp. GSN2]TRW89376.1 YihY/virulence factor BrkB family protein [Flavobacterium sp. GT3R68]
MKKYFTKQAFKGNGKILKDTFTGFIDDKALKFSASLAYYTVFSLAPLLLLLISLVGIFFGREAVEGQLFSEIKMLLGSEAAIQIQEMIKNIELSGKSKTAAIFGGIALIVGATTVFAEIQDSINIIWRVKAKPKRGWLKIVQDRLLSSSIIVALGFLLIVSLVINGALKLLSDFLVGYFPDVTVLLFKALDFFISFAVLSLLFGVIFKVLPDAKIKWKDVRSGAFFTTCLFLLGRYLIGLYLETAGTASTYGAAGSLIIILVWVYYTAAIVYFGAEFTRAYGNFKGRKIEPADYAVYVEMTEKEIDKKTIPLGKKKDETID